MRLSINPDRGIPLLALPTGVSKVRVIASQIAGRGGIMPGSITFEPGVRTPVTVDTDPQIVATVTGPRPIPGTFDSGQG